MKVLTIYEAVDGSRWDDESLAIKRDALVARVDIAMRPLGPSNEAFNGDGYIQHDASDYLKVRKALIELSRESIGEWIDRQEKEHKSDLMTCHPSWFCRMCDGEGPVSRAWERIARIDKQYREWGQQYFANNPSEGKQVRIR